jgi:ABC-type glycerol-3-phosphate transport system permease component
MGNESWGPRLDQWSTLDADGDNLDPARQPIALGLFRAYISYTQVERGFLAALSVIYVIPAVVFYVVARRALQQSVAGGLAGT